MEQTKKRVRAKDADPIEELEIDVTADEPLSKRAARRLKKGRTLKQAPSSQKPLPSEFGDNESDDDDEADGLEGDRDVATSKAGAEPNSKRRKTDTAPEKSKSKSKSKHSKSDGKQPRNLITSVPNDVDEYKKGTNGIWIGNLSFKTSEIDLRNFFTTLKPLGKAKKTSEYVAIADADIVRVSMPRPDGGLAVSGAAAGSVGGRNSRAHNVQHNKGFAYVDFSTPKTQETAIALSERILDGRNVLIKSADNFDGRPAATTSATSGGTAGGGKDSTAGETKILYVGNLSFDMTSDDLLAYLGGSETGIKKVRMATFEDSGKCKGFAFVDFDEVAGVKKVLRDRRLWTMNGRRLKMEFGQDRSLRRKPPPPNTPGGGSGGRMMMMKGQGASTGEKVDARTVKPGRALMEAPRANHAIVASRGEKVNFD